MSLAVSPMVGWSRVALLTDRPNVRGTPTEFRHFGITVSVHSDLISALIGLARDPEPILVVSSDIAGLALDDVLDLAVALCGPAVILGLGGGDVTPAVRTALRAGIRTTVELPLTPERLQHALQNVAVEVSEPARIQAGQLSIDPQRHHVDWAGLPIEVTAREFAILLALVRAHPGATSLERLALEYAESTLDPLASIRVAINHIRTRLADVGASSLIETVRGVGYRLAC